MALNKRFSNKWSAVGSFLYTWTEEYGSSYFGSGAGHIRGTNPSLFSSFAAVVGYPITDADLDSLNEFTTWTFKLHGTYEPGWSLRFTPIFRAQQGYP